MKQKDKIVLLTLGQPSTNPRLLKEAIWFSKKGYEVYVIYCFWSKWGYQFDKDLISGHTDIKWIEIGGNPFTKKLLYLYTRLRHKLIRQFACLFPSSLYWAVRSISRCYYELNNELNKIDASLYVAHNLGALPLVGKRALAQRKPFVFDAEDFHRGQSHVDDLSYHQSKNIEEYWMPKVTLMTTASPFISEKYKQLLGLESIVINNVFSKINISPVSSVIRNPIRLFWFSQTIGKGRGIEDVIIALKRFPVTSFSLTLMGDINEEMKRYFYEFVEENNKVIVDLKILKPVAPEKVFEIASTFDIGLATESHINENVNLVYTNKMFTYMLSGIAILFSSTRAHEFFFNTHKEIGWIYPCGDINKLVFLLDHVQKNPFEISLYKQNAKKLADCIYNWEIEQSKLMHHLNLIDSIA